jgi:protein subunit release factor B
VHIPSSISSHASEERSQEQNREKALLILKAKLFKKAQNGTITNTNTNLSQFPEDSRESIRNLLEFINSYFKSPKNKTEDMLPYEHAIENFKNYPYTLSIQY